MTRQDKSRGFDDHIRYARTLQSGMIVCHSQSAISEIGGNRMKEKRRVLYKKGVFVCPKCRQSYVQDKWMEEWRIRCHKCDYRGTLTEVSVEEHVDEETVRH